MLGYLEYLTVKFLGLIVRILPQKLVIFLGGLIGSLIYFLDRKHSQISLLNLRRAFGVTKTDSEFKKIARRSFMNLSQSFFEILRFPKLNSKSVDSFISIEGREYLDMVHSQGRGGILLTAHLGNWELSAVWASLKGYSLNALAREQKKSRLNFLLNQYRANSGIKVYTKGMAVRDLITALRKNEFVGVLGDQDAGRRGVFVNFFRHPASTHPGPILLALRTGVPILPCFIIRSGFKHKIYVHPPLHLEPKKTGDYKEAIVKNSLQEFSRILESYIWLYPGQWLWVHRRWKTRPIAEGNFNVKKVNIMILSDGKAGHLRQSWGIARGFPAAKVLEVKIDFQSKIWKIFLPLLAPIAKNHCLIKFFLKKSLTENSFQKLNSFFPQAIISAGSSLAAFNLLYGRFTGAKKIVCMKPGIMDIKSFDLVIAPKHDHLPIVKNVLTVFASLHPLRKEDFVPLGKTLKDKFSLKGDKFLGLLIGGETRHFSLSRGTLRKVVEEIKKICETHKFKLLFTTSRRTPIQVERQFKEELRNFSDLELFISPRQDSYNPVGGILGLSEAVVVTEDSISMIAEAASSAKKIIVLQVDRKTKGKLPKHLETINNLVQKGYLYLARADNLSQVINRLLLEGSAPKVLNDTEKAIERVKETLLSANNR